MKMNLGRINIIMVVFLASGLAIMFFCSEKNAVNQKNNNSIRQIPVVVDTVEISSIKEVIYFSGDIKGIEEIDVYSKVSGKLIENKVTEGETVKQGQILAIVDRDIPGMKYEPYEVLSPIPGVVAEIYCDRGATIVPPTMSTTMGTPVMRVVNMKEAKIIINVGDRDYTKVKKGQPAEIKVDNYPDEIFYGKVHSIAPVINPYTKTSPVEILLPNRSLLLRSGMLAAVGLIIQEKEGINISIDSIIKTMDGKVVFVNENGIAKKRKISIGIDDGVGVEVTGGLKKGESLVVVGQEMLIDGANLDIRPFEKGSGE